MISATVWVHINLLKIQRYPGSKRESFGMVNLSFLVKYYQLIWNECTGQVGKQAKLWYQGRYASNMQPDFFAVNILRQDGAYLKPI